MRNIAIMLLMISVVVILHSIEVDTCFGETSTGQEGMKLDSGWLYMKTVTLSPSTPSANVQVKITLTMSNFNYSHAQSNGADLRFYDSSNNLLSYWIETWNPSGNSVIWVNVLSSGTSTLTMYYGNSQATAASNGENTFIFFDDFSSFNSSKWTKYNEGGEGIGTDMIDVTGGCLWTNGASNNNRGLYANATMNSNGVVIETMHWIESSTNYSLDGDPMIWFTASSSIYFMLNDNDESVSDSYAFFINDNTGEVFGWYNGSRFTETYDARGKWTRMVMSRSGNTFTGKM